MAGIILGPPRNVIARARELEDAGDYRAAIALVRPLLALVAQIPRSQEHVDLLRLTVVLNLQDGAAPTAARCLRELAMVGDKVENLAVMAAALAHVDRPAKAIRARELLCQRIGTAESYVELTLALAGAERFDDVGPVVDRGLALFPHDENLLAIAGDIKAVDDGPYSALPIRLYGGRYAKRSRIADALTYLVAENYEFAESMLGSLIVDYPFDAYLWYCLARVYDGQDRLSDAILALEEAVAISPEESKLWVALTYATAKSRKPLKFLRAVVNGFYRAFLTDISRYTIAAIAKRDYPELWAKP